MGIFLLFYHRAYFLNSVQRIYLQFGCFLLSWKWEVVECKLHIAQCLFYPGTSVTSFLHSQYIATEFLLASYDGQHTAGVSISYSYWEKTCGLCGTFDGDKSNDFVLPNGELVSTVQYLVIRKYERKLVWDYTHWKSRLRSATAQQTKNLECRKIMMLHLSNKSQSITFSDVVIYIFVKLFS